MEEIIKEFCNHTENLLLGKREHDDNVEDIAGFLQDMEENDPGFDSLRLVQHVKLRLRGELVQILQKATNEIGNSNVDVTVEQLRLAPEFVEFKKNMLKEISSAIRVVQHVQRSPKKSHNSAYLTNKNSPDESSTATPLEPFTTSPRSWMSGSLAQSTFLFMGKNYLRRAVAILNRSNGDVSAKIEVLRKLSQIPSSEIGHSDHWSEIIWSATALLHNSSLYRETIQFCIKMFNSTQAQAAVDVFTALTGTLQNWPLPNDTELNGFIAAFLLWNSMLRALPNVWTRYPQNLVQQIIESTFDYLTAADRFDSPDPFVLLTLVDSTFIWFDCWMHGKYSREKVLAYFYKNNSFIRKSFNIIAERKNDADLNKLTPFMVGSTLTESCLNICIQILSHADCLETAINNASDTVNTASYMLNQLLQALLQEQNVPDYLTEKCILKVFNCNEISCTLLLDPDSLETMFGYLSTNPEKNLKTKVILISSLEKAIQCHHTKSDCEHFFGRFIELSLSLLQLDKRQLESNKNLLVAVLNANETLCGINAYSSMLKKSDFVNRLGGVVTEAVLHCEVLLPFMAVFDAVEETFEQYRPQFWTSEFMQFSQNSLIVEPLLADCFFAQMEKLINSTAKENIACLNRGLLIQKEVNFFSFGNSIPALIFSVILQSNAMKFCLEDSRFDRLLQHVLSDCQSNTSEETGKLLQLCNLFSISLQFCSVLETNYQFSDRLKHTFAVKFGTRSESSVCVSPISVDLAKMFLKFKIIGGPNERILDIDEKSDDFPLSLEVLDDNLASYFRAEPSRFLVKRILVEEDKLPAEDLIRYFYESLDSRQRIPHAEILSCFAKHTPELNCVENSEVRQQNWKEGLAYGHVLKILVDLKKATLDAQQIMDARIYSHKSSQMATDWFALIAFLLFEGNVKKCRTFLESISFGASEISTVWAFHSGPEAFNKQLSTRILPLMLEKLEAALPAVHVALKNSHLPLIGVLSLWLNQCFLNILDWPEVCNYFTLSILGGFEYQVYFSLSVIKHMEHIISICSHCHEFYPWINHEHLKLFKFRNYLTFVKKLKEN